MSCYHEIIPNLYIGNQYSTKIITTKQIDYIISIGCQSKSPYGISNTHVGIKDCKDIDISTQLDEVTTLIHDLISQNKKVLVHCQAGINRSPSFVLAYLCKYHESMDLQKGIQYIKSKRQICKFSLQNQVEKWMKN